MADIKVGRGSAAAITITLNALATSAGLLAGRQSNEVDYTTPKYLSTCLKLIAQVSTSAVTAGTFIEYWMIPKRNGLYPAGFGTADANVTVPGRVQLLDYGYLLQALSVPVTTASAVYESRGIETRELGILCPEKFVIWVVQNTGQSLAASGHTLSEQGDYLTV